MKTNFESKEHYLEFRKAWAVAVNDERAKQTLVKYEHTPWGWKKGTVVSACDRRKGWITAAHHVVFNVLCERPVDTGFTTTKKEVRIANGALWNSGIFRATSQLNGIIKQIQYIAKHPDSHFSWHETNVNNFLEPFNGTVTREMITKLEIADTQQYLTPPPITPVERFVA